MKGEPTKEFLHYIHNNLIPNFENLILQEKRFQEKLKNSKFQKVDEFLKISKINLEHYETRLKKYTEYLKENKYILDI